MQLSSNLDSSTCKKLDFVENNNIKKSKSKSRERQSRISTGIQDTILQETKGVPLSTLSSGFKNLNTLSTTNKNRNSTEGNYLTKVQVKENRVNTRNDTVS